MIIVRIIDRITDGAAFLGICGLPPLIAIMVYEVFCRYVLNAPTTWSFELSWMLMGYIFMMGISYALKRHDHVSVDLIHGNLPPRGKAIVDVVGYVLLLPCITWLSYRTGAYALAAFHSGETSGISAWNPVLWPFRTAIFVGFAVFTLQVIAELIRAAYVAVAGAQRTESK